MKLKLVYQRMAGMSCIPHPHWDLCTDEEKPINIACILSSGKEENAILKKMVKLYNDNLSEEIFRKTCDIVLEKNFNAKNKVDFPIEGLYHPERVL